MPAPKKTASKKSLKPTRAEAEEAIRVLLRWTGDDPSREGLHDTPARVCRAYEAYGSGYGADPEEILSRTFSETEGYDEMVVLRDIRLESHCEHHLAPIIGKVHVAYLPRNRVVGISKLARVVDAYAKRLQIQEKLTAQIAHAIESALKPRGVHKPGTSMVTSKMTGAFRDDPSTRREFLSLIGSVQHTSRE